MKDKYKHIFEDKIIDHISVVFENCEAGIVPQKYIKHITIGDIKSTYSTYSNLYPEIHIRFHTDFLYITFKNLKDIMYTGFKGDPKKSLLDRIIRCRDITHIHFYFKDKTDLYLGVPWNDAGSQYTNFQQIFKQCINYYDEVEYKMCFSDKWNNEIRKNVIKYWMRYGVRILIYNIKHKIEWKIRSIKWYFNFKERKEFEKIKQERIRDRKVIHG